MFRTLVAKELKQIVLSPRFAGAFAACAILLLLSTWVGVGEYRAAVRQQEVGEGMAAQQLREATSWARLSAGVVRAPEPLQVFVAGTAYDIGRNAQVSGDGAPKADHPAYEDDPLFALFRAFDPTLIILAVLPLLAILFTHDTVCGEKERGTLRLVLANAVPRRRLLAAKFSGAWLGITVPLAVPAVLCLLMALLGGVPLGGGEWARLALLGTASLFYLTFWIALGLLISTLARRSSQALLTSLVAWIALVFVVPRAGVLIATQLSPVPSENEVAGQVNAFSRGRWEQMMKDLRQLHASAEQSRGTDSEAAGQQLMANVQQLRAAATADIEAHEQRLNEDLSARLAQQRRLALGIARISPAAAFQLAAMTLAGTDVELKDRFLRALSDYRTVLAPFVERRQQETGQDGRIMIRPGPDGLRVSAPKRGPALDLTGLPRYVPPVRRPGDVVGSAGVDAGILILGTLLAIGAAHARFLRYDPR